MQLSEGGGRPHSPAAAPHEQESTGAVNVRQRRNKGVCSGDSSQDWAEYRGGGSPSPLRLPLNPKQQLLSGSGARHHFSPLELFTHRELWSNMFGTEAEINSFYSQRTPTTRSQQAASERTYPHGSGWAGQSWGCRGCWQAEKLFTES